VTHQHDEQHRPEPIWPNYEVGPHKIVFALGVVSINLARFERVITWMLAATTGYEETEAETILRPLPPAEKLRRLKRKRKLAAFYDVPESAITITISH
jgi:hypothetical protein